jgi:hypothetical protein
MFEETLGAMSWHTEMRVADGGEILDSDFV